MNNKRLDGVAETYYRRHGLAPRQSKNNRSSNLLVLLESMYTRILSEMASNRFKWSELPDSVDERYLELTLFNSALSVFYDDRDFGYLALPGQGASELNWYNDPISFHVMGGSRIRKTISTTECVPIWANYQRIPDLDIVKIYARDLAQTHRSVQINTLNARRTKVLAVAENQRLSATNIIAAIDEGEPVIKLNKAFDMEQLKALDMGQDTKSIADLQVSRTRIFTECMGMLGINGANQDKKERLVESEVSANDEQIYSMKRVNLNAREQACDKINKMFKLNIGVEYHTEEVPESDEETTDPEKEKE